MLQRHNILSLIGRHRSRYTSCIITCYSFDFAFFEERVMSALRMANIKNVNVFLDGKFLENYFENTSGREFKTHRTYSYTPVYEAGVFHPKIMLLTGPKEGLLIIGSGNITSSGLSSNDEIWGAFHLNSLESKNAPIFASAWSYLQGFFANAQGFNTQKLSWFSQYSPWLNNLEVSMDFVNVDKGVDIKFISNGSTSLYQQIVSVLPRQDVKQLTIISPYYDKSGQVIEQLITDVKANAIDCVVDAEYGLIPVDLSTKLSKLISFYDWKDCNKEFKEKYNRLHAKLFHFQYKDGIEYLVIGSANASLHALGTLNLKAKNAEACLIIRRRATKTYLDELGIKIANNKRLLLNEIPKKKPMLGNKVSYSGFEYRITHAELSGQKLAVYVDKPVKGASLFIFNSFDEIIITKDFTSTKATLVVEIPKVDQLFKIGLFKKKQRISNYSLVHHVDNQAKTNPDSTLAELNTIIEALSADPDNDQYIELLRYVDYPLLDEPKNILSSPSGTIPKRHEERPVKSARSLTNEEFDQLKSKQSFEHDLHNNPNIQISEALRIISSGLIKKSVAIVENQEELLAKEGEGSAKGEGGQAPQVSRVVIKGRLIERAIYKHLSKLDSYFFDQLENLKRERVLNSSPSRPISIKELSVVAIALELIYIFHGRKYEYDKTEFSLNYQAQYVDEIRSVEKKYKLTRLEKTDSEIKNRTFYEVDSSLLTSIKDEFNRINSKLWVDQSEYIPTTYYEDYFEEGVYTEEEKSGIKYFLIEMLGGFLASANPQAGFINTEFEEVNEKIKEMRKRIFECGTFLCLNLTWRESEIQKRKILLLDLLNSVNPNFLESDSTHRLSTSLKELYNKAKFKSDEFYANLSVYIMELVPQFISWKSLYEYDRSKLTEPVKGQSLRQIVYSRFLGFVILRTYGFDYLIIEKPGVLLEGEEEDLIKIRYPQKSIIVYK